jgi:hypothetical protein
LFGEKRWEKLPDEYWINHVATTFVETVKWWIEQGMQESAETLAEYFLAVV